MIIYNFISSCYLLYCVTNIICAISGEYYINPKDLSYLYHKFDNIEDTIFPSDIRIQVSLSRISGTLLYSIDKNMNQLIVSLYNIEGSPRIDIESNGLRTSSPLSKLCGCYRCRYQILDFRIQIKDNISIECNYEPGQEYKKAEGKYVNENYPIPYSMPDSKRTSHKSIANEAHLWLVNTPGFKDIPHNKDQMYGCIHQVWYKGLQIVFMNTTSNVVHECRKTCVNNVCNGGRCHETYSRNPMCNCKKTFLNGLYCNSSITPKNLQIQEADLNFHMFKLSWRTFMDEIFILKNEKVHIQFRIDGNEFSVQLRYIHNNKELSMDFIHEYVANEPTICIVFLYVNNINVYYFSNDRWYRSTEDIKIDLRSQIFNFLLLRSRFGIIDMTYKNDLDYVWKKMNFEDAKHDHMPDTF